METARRPRTGCAGWLVARVALLAITLWLLGCEKPAEFSKPSAAEVVEQSANSQQDVPNRRSGQNVGHVSDFDRKVKLETEVFKEWEKKDHDAAVKAWEELFPPGK